MRVRTHFLRVAAALALAGGLALGPLPARGADRSAQDPATPATPDTLAEPAPETLEFTPSPEETPPPEPDRDQERHFATQEEWLSAPFGEGLLTEPDAWHARHGRHARWTATIGYNRVDALRLGVAGQMQDPSTLEPRLGGRAEYALDRERLLYGIQLEQPLLPHGRLGIGVSMSRRTDHSELQQVDDIENSLDLLFARADFRDYFEREGFGAYLAWRVPDFSVVSVHVRNDTYRSLPLRSGTRSLFMNDQALRDNPPVDEGDIRAVLLRLERQARHTRRAKAGLYHWIEIERAGGGLSGDFEYTRALADVRSVLRLSPTATLVLRAVAGSTAAGRLPEQKRFMVGGVDGLRAHTFAEYHGDQMLLGQAEYLAGLCRPHTHGFKSRIHVLAFVDAGRAWDNPDHRWDLARQQIQVDGGFGVGSGDALRVYVARNLQQPNSKAVLSLRLQRPF